MGKGEDYSVVFMGTPTLAVSTLKALVGNGYRVVEALTQPDKPSGRGKKLMPSPVKEAAMSLGIPVYQPESLKPDEVQAHLRDLGPDLIVVTAYGLIIPRAVLGMASLGTLNVHPSLLPRHRGPSPIASAILAGDEDTGVTIMLVEPRVDAGPVLSSRRLKIEYEDTTGSLTCSLGQMGAELLIETLPRWLRGEITPISQDETRATYSRMISKEDGEIDWRLPAVELWRKVRAFDPWPGAYTFWQGKRFKVLRAASLRGGKGVGVGEVVQVDGGPVVVGTGEGLLELKEVQIEGRRATEIKSFVLGARGLLGTRLPS